MVYSKDALYATGIHSLRNIARKLGVKKPTQLKKKQLIEEMLKIQKGLKKPAEPSGRGRPLKTPVEERDKEIEEFLIKTAVNDENTENTFEEELLDEKTIEKRAKQELIKKILKKVERELNKLI